MKEKEIEIVNEPLAASADLLWFIITGGGDDIPEKLSGSEIDALKALQSLMWDAARRER